MSSSSPGSAAHGGGGGDGGLSLRNMLLRPVAQAAAAACAVTRPLDGVPNLSPEDRVLLENVIAVVYAVVDGTGPVLTPAEGATFSGALVDFKGIFTDAASAERFHVLVFKLNMDPTGGPETRAVFALNKGIVDTVSSVNELRVADVALRVYATGGGDAPVAHSAALVVHVLKGSEPVFVDTCDVVRVRQKRRFL